MSNKITYVLKEAKNKKLMENNEQTAENQDSNSWFFTDSIGEKLEVLVYVLIGFGPSLAALHALGKLAT